MSVRFHLYRQAEYSAIECHGDLLEAVWTDADGTLHREPVDRPRIGAALHLSSTSLLGKSPAHEVDWWMTTPIIAILEEDERRVLFRTQNSLYEWSVDDAAEPSR